jgi:hypothetical protein
MASTVTSFVDSTKYYGDFYDSKQI